MLSGLLLLFCSANAALAEDTGTLGALNELLLQSNYLPGVPVGIHQSEVAPTLTKTQSTHDCPATKILQQIEGILSKLLNEDYGRNNPNENIVRQDDPDNVDLLTGEVGSENLIIPMSKIRSLKQLLENSKLQKKLRTKITVRYQLPSVEDLDCKQTLARILQMLKESNYLREHHRTCGANDNCPTENFVEIKNNGHNNVLSTAINQGKNYEPSIYPSLSNNQASAIFNGVPESQNQDLSNLLKQLLSIKTNNEILTTKEQIHVNNNTHSDYDQLSKPTKELKNEINVDTLIPKDSVQDSTKNFQVNNKPYQVDIIEQVLSPSVETTNENANLSKIIADTLLYKGQTSLKQNPNLDKKPDNLLLTTTNEANIVSLVPSNYSENIENNISNDGETITNIETIAPNNDVQMTNIEGQKEGFLNIVDYISDANLKDSPKNITTNKITPVIDEVKQKGDYNDLINNLLKYQLQKVQPASLQTNEKYLGISPYYVNRDVILNNIKNPSPSAIPNIPVYQTPYQIGTGFNGYYTNYLNPYNQYSNLNLLNQRPNPLNNQNMLYQTSYGKANPYFVNPKLIDNTKHDGQQLYAPYNLPNLQRMVGVSNQAELNSAPDNNGVVELTYMLKQPKPVVYQPVYFVKYRLPYESFVRSLRELLVRKPQLRTDPAKLYQELLAISKIAEISPTLQGLGKQQLMQMVTTNGALVKTKVLKINETALDKQLESVQNFNSMLAPNEIVNVKYSIEANKQPENSGKPKLATVLSDQSEISKKYLDLILHPQKNVGNVKEVVNTELPSTKLLQGYDVPNIPPLG
ncbi:unnamed protein product, partial [Iphiclides podalirius]